MANIGDFEGFVCGVYVLRVSFKVANIRYLQLQGRQNATIEVSLRLF